MPHLMHHLNAGAVRSNPGNAAPNAGVFREADQRQCQGHQRTYTMTFFKNLLTESGFSIDFFKGLFLKPFANSQMDSFDDEIFSGLFKLADDFPDESAAILYAECSKKT